MERESIKKIPSWTLWKRRGRVCELKALSRNSPPIPSGWREGIGLNFSKGLWTCRETENFFRSSPVFVCSNNSAPFLELLGGKTSGSPLPKASGLVGEITAKSTLFPFCLLVAGLTRSKLFSPSASSRLFKSLSLSLSRWSGLPLLLVFVGSKRAPFPFAPEFGFLRAERTKPAQTKKATSPTPRPKATAAMAELKMPFPPANKKYTKIYFERISVHSLFHPIWSKNFNTFRSPWPSSPERLLRALQMYISKFFFLPYFLKPWSAKAHVLLVHPLRKEPKQSFWSLPVKTIPIVVTSRFQSRGSSKGSFRSEKILSCTNWKDPSRKILCNIKDPRLDLNACTHLS